jgi:spore coat protein CotF
MVFGAHETMEVHEILNEKIHLINHLSLYAEQAQNSQLRTMIERQLQDSIQSYNQFVNYTQTYQTGQMATHANPATSKPMAQETMQDVQYGLRQPTPVSPQMKGQLNDQQILSSLLILHKNSAKNAMSAALECADSNLRQMLLNASYGCANQAFETFFVMNQQGLYQVPTMNDHTAKTFLHTFQPMNTATNYQQ